MHRIYLVLIWPLSKEKVLVKNQIPVLEDWIELPKEILEKHSRIELCIDVMYINGVGLMTAID